MIGAVQGSPEPQSPAEESDLLPVDPITGRPLAPTVQPGYYSGLSTMAMADFWDAATRETVFRRVYEVPPIEFFDGERLPLARAVFDRLIPQDDRLPVRRIPTVNYVDFKLKQHISRGYRFEDMPEDGDAMLLGLRAIDEIARFMYHCHFVMLDPGRQDVVLFTIHDSKPPAAHDVWAQMNVEKFWQFLIQLAIGAYYSHPWAWDEIGFGGPAYPRGYMRLEGGLPEPWEVDEARYEWEAPPSSLSGECRPLNGSVKQHHSSVGTH